MSGKQRLPVTGAEVRIGDVVLAQADERKFQVRGWSDEGAEWVEPVQVRCWVCGGRAEFGGGPGGRQDAVGLEELTDWARGHECARMRVC